jgi:hypothetical protein
LQEHHQAEQQELLEKQYEEHLALMELHEEARSYRRSRATVFKHRMQHPLMLLLSCTMPRVGCAAAGTWQQHHNTQWLSAKHDEVLQAVSAVLVLMYQCCCVLMQPSMTSHVVGWLCGEIQPQL